MSDLYELQQLEAATQKLMTPENQRVVCAANLFPGGILVLGLRHGSPDMRLSMHRMDLNFVDAKQGFSDQWGNFLTRQEAFKIAQRNGQLTGPGAADNASEHLFSEDLY